MTSPLQKPARRSALAEIASAELELIQAAADKESAAAMRAAGRRTNVSAALLAEESKAAEAANRQARIRELNDILHAEAETAAQELELSLRELAAAYAALAARHRALLARYTGACNRAGIPATPRTTPPPHIPLP